jgi:vacuolar-type H+-ATPase subunit F/Vma7
VSRFIVITRPDLADGFRLAGVETIAVNNAEEVVSIITPWLEKKDDLLIAMDDGIFSLMDKGFIGRIYAASHILLVTIPDGPIQRGENTRKERLFEMIRHATGIKFSFKGEEDDKS